MGEVGGSGLCRVSSERIQTGLACPPLWLLHPGGKLEEYIVLVTGDLNKTLVSHLLLGTCYRL